MAAQNELRIKLLLSEAKFLIQTVIGSNNGVEEVMKSIADIEYLQRALFEIIEIIKPIIIDKSLSLGFEPSFEGGASRINYKVCKAVKKIRSYLEDMANKVKYEKNCPNSVKTIFSDAHVAIEKVLKRFSKNCDKNFEVLCDWKKNEFVNIDQFQVNVKNFQNSLKEFYFELEKQKEKNVSLTENFSDFEGFVSNVAFSLTKIQEKISKFDLKALKFESFVKSIKNSDFYSIWQEANVFLRQYRKSIPDNLSARSIIFALTKVLNDSSPIMFPEKEESMNSSESNISEKLSLKSSYDEISMQNLCPPSPILHISTKNQSNLFSHRFEQNRTFLDSHQDLATQFQSLLIEKKSLEVALKYTEQLLLIRDKEKESLSAILVKAKEKLQHLKALSDSNKLSVHSRSVLKKKMRTETKVSIISVIPMQCSQSLQHTLVGLSNKLKQNSLVQSLASPIKAIQCAVDLLVNLKNLIPVENLEKSKNLNESFLEAFKRLRQQISLLEKDSEEKNKKILELTKIGIMHMRSESRGVCGSLTESDKVNIEVSKLLNKKKKIKMHKEQIFLLKERIRELQKELDYAASLDVVHVKELWWSLGKEIPVLEKNHEETLGVFMRMLGFSSKDILMMGNVRRDKKVKSRFSLF